MQNTIPGTPTTTRLDPAVLKLGAVIVVGSLTAMLDMTMVTVALADLTRTFGTAVTTVQWVSTAYLLAIATVIRRPGGWPNDSAPAPCGCSRWPPSASDRLCAVPPGQWAV